MNDVCHFTIDGYGPLGRSGRAVWRLGRPLCGAVNAPRCAPEQDVPVPDTDRCPRCGRPWCPRCREQVRASAAKRAWGAVRRAPGPRRAS
jgi:hypothetical protein